MPGLVDSLAGEEETGRATYDAVGLGGLTEVTRLGSESYQRTVKLLV